MCPAQHEGPVDDEDPIGFSRRPAPARSPSAASQGAMWTIFKEIIASNGASSSTPHTLSRTSMATGACTLVSPSVALHAKMLSREAASDGSAARGPRQRLRERDDMLSGTGSNFERDALLRQNPNKHLSDWTTIARS